MLSTLKDLWASLAALPAVAEPDPVRDAHRLQLATAVLLVEVMRADAALDAAERQAVLAALREHVELSDDELARLLELAEQTAARATDLFAFTSRLDERLAMPAKIAIVEQMWRVALADGRICAHERHLLWRVADLLHVPQGAYHHARQRAQQHARQRAEGAEGAEGAAGGGT